MLSDASIGEMTSPAMVRAVSNMANQPGFTKKH